MSSGMSDFPFHLFGNDSAGGPSVRSRINSIQRHHGHRSYEDDEDGFNDAELEAAIMASLAESGGPGPGPSTSTSMSSAAAAHTPLSPRSSTAPTPARASAAASAPGPTSAPRRLSLQPDIPLDDILEDTLSSREGQAEAGPMFLAMNPLAAEPPDADAAAVHIKFKLPGGATVVRRFRGDAPLIACVSFLVSLDVERPPSQRLFSYDAALSPKLRLRTSVLPSVVLSDWSVPVRTVGARAVLTVECT
jgi:hypothetical protein